MIVKSSYRAIGGLEAHLLRNDINERVRLRTDLFRGADDLHTALRLMDGIARSNPKAVRSIVHIVISPGHGLSDVELIDALTMIEAEHGIAPDAPRAVVQHDKGNRPAHFHAAYSIVDLATGLALKSQGNYERDELISRRLELRFGETVVPGPRLVANIAELRRRGFDDEADRLAPFAPARTVDGLSRADRQQATRLSIDGLALSRAVFALFEEAERDLGAFGDLANAAGYAVCRGGSATLILEEATGYSTSFVRLLRREAKAAGRPLDLKEQAVVQAFPDARPMAEERDRGLGRAQGRADAAVHTERQRAAFEAIADGDLADLTAYQAKRRQAAAEQDRLDRAAVQESLRARRDAIIQAYRKRDAIRRRRVDRAFRHARLFATPGLRRLAFGLAAAGVLMTGASLAMALAAGGVAISLLPSRAAARRHAAVATRERQVDAEARRSAIGKMTAQAPTASAPRSNRVRFSFDQIAKPDRILAGFYAVALIHAGASGAGISNQAKRVMAALGPEIVQGLTRMVERGSALQVNRLRHWYRGTPADQRDRAVEAALRRREAEAVTGERPARNTKSVPITARPDARIFTGSKPSTDDPGASLHSPTHSGSTGKHVGGPAPDKKSNRHNPAPNEKSSVKKGRRGKGRGPSKRESEGR